MKVRGGEVLGEFATLVDPGRPIPPQIIMLTGITDRMVGDAPRIEAVLAGFLEFARGSVLVAHNAPFDIGFLKAACARMSLPWPASRGRHGPAGPPHPHPGRGAERPPRSPGAAARRLGHPRPSSAARREGHRRRPARPVGATRPARGVDPDRVARRQQGRRPRPATQADVGRRTAVETWGVSVPRAERRGPLHRDFGQPAAAGAFLFHCRGGSRTDETDGVARDRVDHVDLRHRARGQGPRAAADRGAPAALQQAVAASPARSTGCV